MSALLVFGFYLHLSLLTTMTTCDGNLIYASLRIKGPQLTERQTRSVSATTLFLQGLRATRKLLVGARKTHSEDRFEIYEKHGSKYTAVREFYSLHPRDVKRVELNQDIHLISGVIGDRHILLIDNGIDANAVIEIVNHNAKQLFEKWDQSGTYGNRIIYKQWYK